MRVRGLLLLPLGLAACGPAAGDELLVAASPAVWFEGFRTPPLISPDGRRAIAGSAASGDLRLIDLASGREEAIDAASAVFGPHGRLALLSTTGGETRWLLGGADGLQPLDLPADAVPAWSPDGERVALYRRAMADHGLRIVEAGGERVVPVDGMITGLGWVPDGGTILVLAADSAGLSSLYRVGLRAAAAAVLVRDLDATLYGGYAPLAVSGDGQSVYLALASAGAPPAAERHRPHADRDLDIYEVDLRSGARRAVVATAADEFAPAVVGGVLYWAVARATLSVIVVPSGGGPARVVVEDAQLPTWRPDGRMLGFSFGDWRQTDWVLNWEAGVVEVDAAARPVGAPRAYVTGYHEDFSPVWSPNGRWIAYHSHRTNAPVFHYHGPGSSDDVYLRRECSGEEMRLTDFGREVGPPSWAPDGTRLVFTGWLDARDRSGAWITAIDSLTGRATSHRRLDLPASVGGAANATWSPAADVIALSAPAPNGRRTLWTIRPDGSVVRKVAEYPLRTYGGVAWTRDGAGLVFPAIHQERMQLFAVSAEGGEPRRLTDDHANLLHPAVSPDGRWIAATRIEHRRELRRAPLP